MIFYTTQNWGIYFLFFGIICAFITNETMRENILWGLPYEEYYYKKCLKASSLSHDLSVLPNGDMTEIGERALIYQVIISEKCVIPCC